MSLEIFFVTCAKDTYLLAFPLNFWQCLHTAKQARLAISASSSVSRHSFTEPVDQMSEMLKFIQKENTVHYQEHIKKLVGKSLQLNKIIVIKSRSHFAIQLSQCI